MDLADVLPALMANQDDPHSVRRLVELAALTSRSEDAEPVPFAVSRGYTEQVTVTRTRRIGRFVQPYQVTVIRTVATAAVLPVPLPAPRLARHDDLHDVILSQEQAAHRARFNRPTNTNTQGAHQS